MREARLHRGGRGKKLLEHAEYVYGARGAVASARQRIEEKNRKKAIREGRPVPPSKKPRQWHFLLPQNRLAWSVFESCNGQVITAGMSGVVLSINHAVFDFEFEMAEVPAERRREVYEKVVVLERWWVTHLNQKHKPAKEPAGGSEWASMS